MTTMTIERETETEAPAASWTLTPAEFAATAAKVAKVNARAAKRGFTGTITVTGTPITKVERTEGGVEVTRHYVETTVTGTAPCYNGWTFLAKIETIGTNLLVKTAPGVSDEDVDRSTLTPGACDHCKVKANRKNTYLVRSVETGQMMQVGSTCIKDFLGWDTNPVWVSDTDVNRDEFEGSGHFDPAFPVAEYVAFAYAAVQAFGWVRSGSFDGISTRSRISDYLFDNKAPGQIARDRMEPFMAEGRTTAQVIIDTVVADFTTPHGYEANMVAALTAEYADGKTFGLLASVVAAYERIIGQRASREAEAAARADKPVAKWLGAKGDKVEITGVITMAMTVDGYAYGTTQRLIVIEAGETLAKMYTSAAWSYEVATGETVTVTGTVKSHDTYKDQQQTVLTRVKRVQA